MNALKAEEEKQLCKAVLRNDEEELSRLLQFYNPTANSSINSNVSYY
jgi:hypothetical protein